MAISLTFLLSADPNIRDLLQREQWERPLNFKRNRSGEGKIVDFRHLGLSRRISKMVQYRSKLLLATNRNMYTRFR